MTRLIYETPNKIYLGVQHGANPNISVDVSKKLKQIANKHGVWYEGNGGDIEPLIGFFGKKSSYQGSWDDDFAKSIKSYPPEYLYTLFTNVKENQQDKSIVNPKMSIFDSILEAQKNIGFFKDRNFDSQVLTDFLQQASDSSTQLLRWSKQQATRFNVAKFLKEGEEKMWPRNWQDYPYNAGKLAKKAEESRNNYLLSAKPGVYVVGNSHLDELKALNNKLKIIDANQ